MKQASEDKRNGGSGRTSSSSSQRAVSETDSTAADGPDAAASPPAASPPAAKRARKGAKSARDDAAPPAEGGVPGAAGDADHDTLLVASETAALDAAQATLVDRSTPLPLLAVARTLSQAVIPVLVREARRSAPVPGDAERDLLMRLLLRGDSDGAMLLGRQCVAAGMRVERLAEELLTPVARSLGSMWEEDSCDFVRVTYGMGILAEMMREMRLVDPPRPPRAGEVMPTILLANAPGEQHSFGIAVVADAFERAGWDVSRAETHDAAALMTQCAAQRYDVVGLSVAADRFLPRLPALIGALRRVARNPGMRIMVGGAALLRQPERASQLGADALAIDSTNAIAVAVAMVQTPPE